MTAKEIPRLPSMSAHIDSDRSINCYNFSVGNGNLFEFFSPNYPNNYPNDTECERVIKAPHGHQISIEFRDQFHLEEATNCEYDYLEIRDGAYGYSNIIAKLCGHEFPRDIISNDRYLFLRFVSDESIQYSGFRAVYSFKKLHIQRPEPPRECRFNKTGVSGIIHHREIPPELQNYSIVEELSIDCIWNITVRPGYQMYLTFNDYGLTIPNNCESNYIDVYNDKLSESSREQRFCGTKAESVRSKSNTMNIRFFAKPKAIEGVKFEIIFTAFRELPNKEKCRSDEFDCADSTCIDQSLKCDGYDNCKYRYDEDKQTTCAPKSGGIFNFTSQHMVVILVVFCALVLGMCASITISCWSKIQERRQRKRDYKLRRSRETSVEVGLDRTMTITSLDRSALENEIAAQQQVLGSVGRTRKMITTANTISRKSGFHNDDELNGCYVPEVDLSVFRKQPNGATQQLIDDKFSPDSPTHMIMSNQISPDCQHYYSHQQQRDSMRSSSESPIPPPPPPPMLSHMRSRQRTVPLDASKLDSCSPTNDNHHLMEQSLHGHQSSVPQMHRPDCAQHTNNSPDYSLRTVKPEYSRSASVPIGPHVSVINDGNDNDDDCDDYCCEDNTVVPSDSRTRCFRAEAIIEMSGSGPVSGTGHRHRGFETTRSAPDVVVMR
ncbi:neuropilin and tolloid-like protein 2 [Oppia nitens]|uniref:neuropilin and tolloid-like protein 2 n=1 Tax=Oppia nitens TaxID=1686743 RepID=UPI0023DA0702|nr:neuropilin and tolloid-like protein 2 [Oppia nitens]